MANFTQTRKNSVDLAAPGARFSRIRRDPPPVVKPVTAAEIKDRDARNTIIGVITIALALFVILIGVGTASGWSPSQYTVHIR